MMNKNISYVCRATILLEKFSNNFFTIRKLPTGSSLNPKGCTIYSGGIVATLRAASAYLIFFDMQQKKISYQKDVCYGLLKNLHMEKGAMNHIVECLHEMFVSFAADYRRDEETHEDVIQTYTTIRDMLITSGKLFEDLE